MSYFLVVENLVLIGKRVTEESEDTFNTAPLQKLLAVIESARKKNVRSTIIDRDEWVITVLLSVLADPNHPAGKFVCKQLFEKWLDRGGEIPPRWKKKILDAAPKPIVEYRPVRLPKIHLPRPPKPPKPVYVHPPNKLQRIKHDAMGFTFALKYLRDCGVSSEDLKNAFVIDDTEYKSYINRKFTDADRALSAKHHQAEI